MNKYLINTLAVILAVNTQTFLFAKDSPKKTGLGVSFEQLLPDSKLNTTDIKNLLSDNSSITLEKILLTPTQRAYNNLTKFIPGADKFKTFETNKMKANKEASFDESYAQALPEAYYKIYEDTIANPSVSPDFNLTPQELTNLKNKYINDITARMQRGSAYIYERQKNITLSFAEIFSNMVKDDILLLSKYYKANNLGTFESLKSISFTVTKSNKSWTDENKHYKELIALAALRVIDANLAYSKMPYALEMARFDIISLFMNNDTDTQIKFGNNIIKFPVNSYKDVPFVLGGLAQRYKRYITALEEIIKKKQNPAYDFATKKNGSYPKRGEDYNPPAPSYYESPYGSGSVR